MYQHNLQNKTGWRWAKKYAKRIGRFINLMLRANQLKQGPKKPTYKFVVRVPDSVQHAKHLNEKNGNTLWQDAISKELAELDEYETFQALRKGVDVPEDYKRIPYRIVFDVKFDLRRKARLVAGGHRTDVPSEDVYSGLVSIDSVRLALFLSILNDMRSCAADIGNAFLHGRSRERYAIRAGQEFGTYAGCILLIIGSLYGLRTSAARWHEYLSETLLAMGFVPSRADPDLRVKDCGTHYEYVAV